MHMTTPSRGLPMIVTRLVAALCSIVGGAWWVAGCGDDDTPPRDAGADACVFCAAPPMGCVWVGGDGCTTCGTVVCADAGPDDGGSGDAAPSDAGPDDAGPDDAGSVDGGGPRDAGPIVCGAGGGGTFPDFDRSCSRASDCEVVLHQVDCCGTQVAWAIAKDEVPTFTASEAACRGMYPACGCPAMATTADDGTVDEGSTAARTRCVEGRCRSTFLPAPAGLCEPGGSDCRPGQTCCYPCGVPGCEYTCTPTCTPGEPGCVGGCIARP
jgi:hypothetical protein